ncbi:hypothetical protein D3C85_1428710 [compost metagenome]
MSVNQSRRLTSIRRGTSVAEVQRWNPAKGVGPLRRQVTSVPPDTSMRDALRIRYETGHPLIVQDEADTVLGVLGNGELYRALLGHDLSRPVPFESIADCSIA